ncbi:hypothetical protein H5410_052379, partial [Solanum commersonii]
SLFFCTEFGLIVSSSFKLVRVELTLHLKSVNHVCYHDPFQMQTVQEQPSLYLLSFPKMSNSVSSFQTLISQEVENPSSFNFSIPPPNETPSTPVCGVGETGESTTPLTKFDHIAKPTKSEKERQRKLKGKLVLGSAIAASRVQIKRARKIGREGIEPEKPTSTPLPIRSSDKKPTSTPLPIRSSDTKSEDVVAYVGPGPFDPSTVADLEMTREKWVTEMEKQKVLNR